MRILVTGLCGNYGGVESFFYGYFNEIIKIDEDITFDVLGYKGVVDADKVIAAGGSVFTVSSFSKNEIKNFMEKHGFLMDQIVVLQVSLAICIMLFILIKKLVDMISMNIVQAI